MADTVIDPQEVAKRFRTSPKILAVTCYRMACTLMPDMPPQDRLDLKDHWLRVFCALDFDTQLELINETRRANAAQWRESQKRKWGHK
jgi:hypothetical protein